VILLAADSGRNRILGAGELTGPVTVIDRVAFGLPDAELTGLLVGGVPPRANCRKFKLGASNRSAHPKKSQLEYLGYPFPDGACRGAGFL
jgi:hypothetical protein